MLLCVFASLCLPYPAPPDTRGTGLHKTINISMRKDLASVQKYVIFNQYENINRSFLSNDHVAFED